MRIEIDSMPSELDELERRKIQLEIEREALRKESDNASKDRLVRLEKELADIKERADTLRAQWKSEKEALNRIQTIKADIESTKHLIEQAERATDLQKAAELKYGTLIELEKNLKKEEEVFHTKKRESPAKRRN